MLLQPENEILTMRLHHRRHSSLMQTQQKIAELTLGFGMKMNLGLLHEVGTSHRQTIPANQDRDNLTICLAYVGKILILLST